MCAHCSGFKEIKQMPAACAIATICKRQKPTHEHTYPHMHLSSTPFIPPSSQFYLTTTSVSQLCQIVPS